MTIQIKNSNNEKYSSDPSPGLTPVIYMKILLEVAAEYGVDKNYVLRRIGMTKNDLEASETYYTIEQHFESLRAIRDVCDIPGFGLIVGCRISIADLGIMGYAMLSSATFRRALDVASRFQRINDPLLHVTYREEGEDAVISIETLLLLGDAYRFDVEETLAIFQQIFEFYFGEGRYLTELKVTWPKTRSSELYKKIFKCPVHYDQEVNEFRFSRELLDKPLSLANDQAARICELQCAEVLRQLSRGNSVADTVRRILINAPGRFPDLNEVAHKLHTSPRNLRRKLAEVNTSFREIADEVKMNLATEYLRDTKLPVEQISWLVGYSDASNFHRAFKKYTNMTPTQFRKSRPMSTSGQ